MELNKTHVSLKPSFLESALTEVSREINFTSDFQIHSTEYDIGLTLFKHHQNLFNGLN
jgi:hypothetical protein